MAPAPTPVALALVGMPAALAVLIIAPPFPEELGLMIFEPKANCICCAFVALGEEAMRNGQSVARCCGGM